MARSEKHFTVVHGIGECVRGGAHTNMIEGDFSIFKCGMIGAYQHCGSAHLKRCLAEFAPAMTRYRNVNRLLQEDCASARLLEDSA